MADREGENQVDLTVSEAPQTDAGLGRARLVESARQLLRVEIGESVEITGTRTTVASVYRSAPEDEGQGIIRINGLVRANARAAIGGIVKVRRAQVLPAEDIVLAPILAVGHKISFGQGIEDFVRRGLLNRPMRDGDSILVPGIALMGGALPFIVIRTMPGGNVRIAAETRISLRETPFHKTEGLSPEEFLRAFTGRLVASLSTLMDEFGDRLPKLTDEAGERARWISKRILELLEDLKGQKSRPGE